MTRDATKTSLSSKGTAEKTASSLPNGWKQVTLGYLQFGVPASWQHKTSTESWIKTLHLYWQGNFDNPDHGLTCGELTNYNKAKSEMGGGSNTTIAGMTVFRATEADSETLLFPPNAGSQGVVIMFFSGGGSASPKAEIIKSIRALP
jgi:hypothetical protein